MTNCIIKPASINCLQDLYLVNKNVETNYFERCLQEQASGKRKIYIAFYNNVPAGYIQLISDPAYNPFRKMDIPEIQDLFVTHDMRKKGIGKKLVIHCEKEAKHNDYTDIGIGVGVNKDYGAAMRLYIKLGYTPDGSGVVYDNQQITVGEMRAVDDFLCLKLVKAII